MSRTLPVPVLVPLPLPVPVLERLLLQERPLQEFFLDCLNIYLRCSSS